MTGRRTVSLPRREVVERVGRIVPLAIAGLLALFLALEVVAARSWILSGAQGFDFAMYMEATRRWLGGGSFYAPYQLVAPYMIEDGAILYPPTALALFVPFTVLPAILWWAIPLGITCWVIGWHLPSRWGWVAILALVVLPAPFVWHFSYALQLIVIGNPGMWILASIAAGTRWGWPAAFVVLKPSLMPFAALGIRTRRWWLIAAIFAALSVALLPLWGQYVTVILNARGPRASLLYSQTDVPLMLIPLVAWLGGRHRPGGDGGPVAIRQHERRPAADRRLG